MRYLLIAVTLVTISPAQAQPSTQMVSARELLDWCSDGSTAGSADALHTSWVLRKQSRSQVFCPVWGRPRVSKSVGPSSAAGALSKSNRLSIFFCIPSRRPFFLNRRVSALWPAFGKSPISLPSAPPVEWGLSFAPREATLTWHP